MADTKQRISIGFQGGQVLAARVTADQLAALRKALGKGAAAGTRSRPRTARSRSTSRRSSTSSVEAGEQRVGFGA